MRPDPELLLADPASSRPLKAVLRVWLGRDPVDAANDAEVLAAAPAGRVGGRTEAL